MGNIAKDTSEIRKLRNLGTVRFCKSSEKPKTNQETEANILFDIGSLKLCRVVNGEIIEDQHLNEIYFGKKIEIYLHFKDVILPETKESLKRDCKIPLVLPLGMMPEQDLLLKNIAISQKMFDEFTYGFCKRDSKYFRKMKNFSGPILSSVSLPGIPEPKRAAYNIMMLIFLLLDDTFDNNLDFQKPCLTIAETFAIVGTFSSVLLGERAVDDISEMEALGFPNVLPMCHLIALLRQEVFQLVENSWQDPSHFFNSYVDYLQALAWETKGWLDETGQDIDALKTFYLEKREWTIGLLPALELCCLYRNINLSKQLRNDPLFISLQKQLSRNIIILNDIFSLEKEVANGETSNLILIRNKSKPADYCFRKTLKDGLDCMKNVEMIYSHLKQKFPEDENLMKYFNAGKIWMDANIQWSVLIRRYGNISFDVEIVL